MAGFSYVQIPGTTIYNLATMDTFCGSKLSNFVDLANAGAIQSGAVIGNYSRYMS